MPIYRINKEGVAYQIKSSSFLTERKLQKAFETNLETLLGIRFIGSEITTGDRQRGRIDTLGLDQDGYPTIVEYKKSRNENVINQGLFYLDWLVDHKGDFAIAAHEKLGTDTFIDWSHPRLVLIAEKFSVYDKYAVNRIGANIELWIYRRYGDDLFYLEPLYIPAQKEKKEPSKTTTKSEEQLVEIDRYSIEDHHLHNRTDQIRELFEQLRQKIFSLADEGEIIEKANKTYIGYVYGKNFCEVRIQTNFLKLWIDIPYDDLNDPYNLARDVSKIGHYGTGQVELKLINPEDVEKIIYLIEQAYLLTT